MIKNKMHLWIFVVGWTIISIILSVVITFGIAGAPVDRSSIIATIGSPLIIAPIVAIGTGHMMLKFHLLTQKLQHALERDHLTDIYNRKYFMERLEALPAETEAAVLMIDIDHFKRVNDTYGHFVGDAVIQHVAQTLASECREGDLVARFGGEEFVVFLCDTKIEDSRYFADRLLKAISENAVCTEGVKVPVTVSIGLSRKERSHKMEDVIRGADTALYDAKQRGRNRVAEAA